MDLLEAMAMVHQATEYQATRSLHKLVETAIRHNDYSDFMMHAFLSLEVEVLFARQVCQRDAEELGYQRSETMSRIVDRWHQDIMEFRHDADLARQE